MRYGRLLALVVMAAAAVAVALPGSASATGSRHAVSGPLHADGRWFRDSHGRVVVLHGLFAVWKGTPFYPPDDATIPNGFTDADADRYAELGFDAVRLAWFWRGLEPAKDQFDPAYLAGIAAVQQKLSRRGVFTVLDSHQDGFGDRFNGLGFPDYVTYDDGLAFDPRLVFPLNYISPATQRAFDNFYANKGDAWHWYGRAWQVMSLRLGRDPMLVGYDLMNEPWPGTNFGACGPPLGCLERDRTTFQPVRLAGALDTQGGPAPHGLLRAHDLLQPGCRERIRQAAARRRPGRALVPQPVPDARRVPGHPRPDAGGEGHAICPPIETSVMQHAEETAARLGGPPLMTEVAATTNEDYDGLNCLLERSERFMTGYTYGLSWRSGELRHLAEAEGGQAAGDRARVSRAPSRAPRFTIASTRGPAASG